MRRLAGLFVFGLLVVAADAAPKEKRRALAAPAPSAPVEGSLSSVITAALQYATRIQRDVLAGMKGSDEAMSDLAPALEKLSRDFELSFGKRLAEAPPEEAQLPALERWRALVQRLVAGIQGDVKGAVKDLQELADEAAAE